jgi:hypothetical protein
VTTDPADPRNIADRIARACARRARRSLGPCGAYVARPADVALARRVDRALRRFWAGDAAPRGWRVSCHHLARAVGALFPVAGARVVDGRFATVFEHSWIELPGNWVLDVYPIGRGDGTCVLLRADGDSPWAQLYEPERLRGLRPAWRSWRGPDGRWRRERVEPGIAGRMRTREQARRCAWVLRRLRATLTPPRPRGTSRPRRPTAQPTPRASR